MKTMPLPSVNSVLRVDEGFMDEDRPPDFFLTDKDGNCWYVCANDLQYMESRSKVNRGFGAIEEKVRSIFKDGKMKTEKWSISAYGLWMFCTLLMKQDPHKMYSADSIVRELKKFFKNGWGNV